MTFFTSYAQNFEDVLLWRALGHVEHGFYIDVGANDPELHSVTKAFYERGWHGINIEPLPHFGQRFLAQRIHDINLPIAAGTTDGEITLFDVPDVDGWATLDPAIADQHRQAGHKIVEMTVQVKRLTTICEQYAGGEIHFLKVDVEGFETEVLQGMDFARWQPWIVVVEATLPNSQVTNHEQWEPILLAHGYTYAYFDGLNRYYVSPKQPQLMQALTLQPNVFDNFHSTHLVKAWQATEAAALRIEQMHNDLIRVDARAQAGETLADKLFEQLRAATAQMQANEAHADLYKRELRRVQAELGAENARLTAVTAALAQLRHDSAAREQHAIATHHALEAHLAGAHALAIALDARINDIYRSKSWMLTKPLRFAHRCARALLRIVRGAAVQATPAPAAAIGTGAAETAAQAIVAPAIAPASPPPAATPAAASMLTPAARRVLADLTAIGQPAPSDLSPPGTTV